MRRAVSSGFTLIANVCQNLPDVLIYPTLPLYKTNMTLCNCIFGGLLTSIEDKYEQKTRYFICFNPFIFLSLSND